MVSDDLQPQFLELPQQMPMADSSSLSDTGGQISRSERERTDDMLEAQLARWIEAACRESPERRRTGQMWRDFNHIYRSGKWWCYYHIYNNHDYYEQALYEMWWKYFWRYLCACNPGVYKCNGKVLSFYDTLSESRPKPVIRRLLKRLKGALNDEYNKWNRIPIAPEDPGDYFAKIPAPSFAPANAYDQILRYLELDPQGELEAIVVGRQNPGKMWLYLKLRFMYPDKPITEIAKTIDIPYRTIKEKRWEMVAKKWERELAERAVKGELTESL